MSKVKKLMSIILTLIMTMSVVAVPVHAATIQKVVLSCNYSGVAACVSGTTYDESFLSLIVKYLSATVYYDDGTSASVDVDENNTSFKIHKIKYNTTNKTFVDTEDAGFNVKSYVSINFTYNNVKSNDVMLDLVDSMSAQKNGAPIKSIKLVSFPEGSMYILKNNSLHNYGDLSQFGNLFDGTVIQYTTYSKHEVIGLENYTSVNTSVRDYNTTYTATYRSSDNALIRSDGYNENDLSCNMCYINLGSDITKDSITNSGTIELAFKQQCYFPNSIGNNGRLSWSSSVTYLPLGKSMYITDNYTKNIEITAQPIKKSYIEGETFDSTGMEVSAIKLDGSKEVINNSDLSYDSKLTAGQTELYVTYNNFYATVPITVTSKEVLSITVNTNSNKTEYYVGEVFNSEGLSLNVTYNDGSRETINKGYYYEPTVISANTSSITVEYGGKTTPVPITVLEKEVDYIKVTKAPNKIEYYYFETFNPEGMEVTAFYNDGTSAIVEGYTYPTTALTSDTRNVTISFNGKTATTPIVISYKTLTKIAVTTPPDKAEYKVGEKFNPEGMIVTATYSDGTTRDFEFDGEDTEFSYSTDIYSGQTRVYITMANLYTTTPINVNGTIDIRTTGIEVVTPPTKKYYINGQSFNPDGMVVNAIMNDGSRVRLNNDELSFNEKLVTGQKEIYITYNNFFTTTPITVVEKEIQDMTIQTYANKSEYYPGETFNPDGLTILVEYTDGTSEILNSGFTYTPMVIDENTKYITVTYFGNSDTMPITILKKNLDHISVTKAPDKVQYYNNDRFDPEGMVVTAFYDDGSSSEVSNYTYSPNILTSDTKNVTISFAGKTTTTPVVVKAKSVVSIKVVNSPDKTTYKAGQVFDPEGMIVELTYDDGSKAETGDYTYPPVAILKGQTEIYITYNGTLYDTVHIEVKGSLNRNITGISVTKQPTKTTYLNGETFDKTGMEVIASYDDNTSSTITDYEIKNTKLSEGQTSVYVLKDNFYAVVPITVTGKIITNIEVTTPPDKTEYVEGEKFNSEGMKVTATYSDGSKSLVAGYTYPNKGLTTADSVVTISYADKTTTTPINVVPKVITKIKITKQPTKIKYYSGEKFNPEGMEVTAYYNDGTSAVITGYTYPTTSLSETDNEINIEYGGFSDLTNIVVSNKKIISIKVTTPPAKTIYKAGEVFVPIGMVVTATFDDSTTRVLNVSEYSYSDTAILKDQSDIVITYNGLYDIVPITVKGNVNPQIVRIKVTETPDKVTYLDGEEFDPSGMVVTAYYDDDSNKKITDYEIRDSKLSEGQTSVYVLKDNFYDVVSVTVTPKVVTSIEVTKAPDKTEYVEGEKFNSEGMKVTATYSDGSKSEVTGYTYSNDALSKGKKTMKITYAEKETTTPITVVEKQVIAISVTTPQNKLSYFVGEKFNPAGMKVTAYYNDNTFGEVVEYEYYDAPLSKDDDKVRIEYNGFIATTPVVVSDKKLVYLDITKLPNKLDYIESEKFIPDGMEITGHYSDNSTEVIKNYSYSNNVLYTDAKTVYITYNNIYISLNVNVKAAGVADLKIIVPPVKTEYIEGQVFDPTGMVVEVTYESGHKEIITDYSYSTDKLTIKDNKVVISKDGKDAEQPIRVNPKVLTKIKVTTPPDRVIYIEGEKFNSEGMIVTGYYNDGSSDEIIDYTYPTDEFKSGDTSVIIEKNGFSDIVDIKLLMANVNDYIKGLRGDVNRDGFVTNEDAQILSKYLGEVNTNFNKYAIHTGDIDADGAITSDDVVLINKYIAGTISINGNNLINADINNDGLANEIDSMLLLNHTRDMWSLNDIYNYNADANADGKINMNDVNYILDLAYRQSTIDHIEIIVPPNKTEYIEGQEFDPEGMVVEAVYLDGTREEITEYTYPLRPLEVADDKVIINYKGFEAEQPIDVDKNMIIQSTESTSSSEESTESTTSDVDSSTESTSSSEESTESTTEDIGNADGIKIVRLPYKTEYIEDQVFDPTGILIKVFWTNGDISYITEKDVTINDKPLEVGDKFGTIYYEYKWDTEKINVPITVIARKPVSVEIITPPDKVNYTEGEEFDPTGTEVEITYNDGTKKVVSDDDITVVDKDPLTKDDTSVTVEVEGIEVEIPISVVEVTTEETTESTAESTTETTTKANSGNGNGGSGGNGGHRITTTETTTEGTTTNSVVEEETEVTTNNRFKDVINHWSEEYVEYLHNLGIVNGVTDGLYKPDTSTKRGDFALVLYRMLKLNKTDDCISFTDVPSDSYYSEAIKACAAADIFIGYGDGTFKPEQTITREEMMVIMAKLFNINKMNYDFTSKDFSALDNYKDGESVSWWAKPYVCSLIEIGAIVGDNGNIKPQADITRAEMATVIYKYLTK